jgi:hypothetical protein
MKFTVRITVVRPDGSHGAESATLAEALGDILNALRSFRGGAK